MVAGEFYKINNCFRIGELEFLNKYNSMSEYFDQTDFTESES